MYFKQILNEGCGCSSYVLASRQTNEAAIFDPQLEIDGYLELLRERRLILRYVIDTHLHADHISGNRRLARATGAQVCLYKDADVLFPFRGLADGEEVPLGQLVLRVMHTPGHRPESISIAVINPPRSPEPSMVITGNTLLVGDVGRPDFGGQRGAAELYDSIQRLLQLEDYVEVFPSHFEGFCGKGMCGRPSSTIGFERRFNPVLQVPSKEEFVKLIAGDCPARPLNMEAMMATNRGERDMEWAMPRADTPAPPALTTPELRERLAHGWQPFLLDVREPQEYQEVHVPGAVSLPQSELATRLDEVPRDRDVVVICRSGARSERAARFLQQVGYQHVINLAGGTLAWVEDERRVSSAS